MIEAGDIRPVQESSTEIFNVLGELIAAKSAYANHDYEAAFRGFRYVYFHDKTQEDAAIGYANAALALGDIQTAKNIYLSLNSDAAITGQVLTAVLAGEVEPAEAALRGRLKKHPEDGRLWNALGRILDQQSRYKAARQAYVVAGQTHQRAGLMENNLGLSFLAEGQITPALIQFKLASAKAPHDRRFDNNRRLALLLKQDYLGALQALPADRASTILTDAGLMAWQQDDVQLAYYLMDHAQKLSPVYDAKLSAYIEALSKLI